MRRLWREKIHPLLWLLAASVLLGCVLGQVIARADVPTAGQAYAAGHAADICMALDDHPTVRGVWDLLLHLTTEGLSGVEAGVAVRESALNVCPHHIPLLKRFAAAYVQHPTGVTT